MNAAVLEQILATKQAERQIVEVADHLRSQHPPGGMTAAEAEAPQTTPGRGGPSKWVRGMGTT